MASLSETIALLANPAPVLDPEDDVDIETAAKVHKSSDNNESHYIKSELRSKAAALDNYDPDYVGKKVSRKSLDGIFQDDDLNSDTNSDSDEEEEEESEDDNDLEGFKQTLDQEMASDEESEQDDDSSESGSSLDGDTSEDMVNKFSTIDVASEMEKGAAVKAQQELWNRLCEARIKLQKLLILANKLPQSDCWNILKKNGKEISDCMKKGSNSMKLLLNSCLDLQAEILQRIPEMDDKVNDNGKIGKLSDEEILSDTDEEMEKGGDLEENQEQIKKVLKRKLKCDEYGEMLTKRHKSLIPYRNSVIHKWDEKTKLSSGKITQKSFLAFESSALKQIEQILKDEDRLIKRTQLKRSLYRILGKPDISEKKTEENLEIKESVSKQDMLLRDYDVEIFDDDDFYRQLLKDVIESKSVGIDPAVLRKQMEIQSIRNKIKRKVDTRASKGRKIRYDIHPKLVGFMRKIETTTITDDARENILKSFFGRSYNNS